jgi:5-methylcytosine-specific restriction endonuclease McrA
MDTLVLSPLYEPMNQITWDDALTLEILGKVEVLERHDDWVVRSVSCEFKVPAVVRFLAGAKGWRKRGARFSRENVYTRDKGKCQYCGRACARDDFTFDHVLPRTKGGTTRWENVVVACLACNQKKGSRTLAEAGMRLLKKPIRPASLHDSVRITIPGGKIPAKWQAYLRSEQYWHGELAEE